MDTIRYINELRAERASIYEAIAVLTRLAQGSGPRRGRPPAWLGSAAPQGRKFSPATRRRMSAAQKKRWKAAAKAEAV